MTNSLCIHHHTGLGDHFNCSGMVRYLSKKYKKTHVIAKQIHAPIVKYMYQDDPNIIVGEIPTEPWSNERGFATKYFTDNNLDEFLIVGHQYYPWGDPILTIKNPWELFYDQLKLDYKIRTEYFVWNRSYEEEDKIKAVLNPQSKKYAFIHEDKNRKWLVDRSLISKDLFIIENPSNVNPFFLYKIFTEAEEIHCIDSSIKCLIDSISVKSKLFLHQVREYAVGTTNNTWNIA